MRASPDDPFAVGFAVIAVRCTWSWFEVRWLRV